MVLFCGFWAFHSFTVGDIREQTNLEIAREGERLRATIAQNQTANSELRDAARREYEAKAEVTRIGNQATTRELELKNQAALAQLEAQSRREKENLGQIIEGLRLKLSVSRSSLEISAAGDFLAINALLIDEQRGREILAAGGFANVRRLLLPDYASVDWQKIEGVSIAQVDGYLREKTIRLRPEEVSEDHIDWQPLFTMWVKDSSGSVGIVGAAQLSKTEFVNFLQRGSDTTTKTITTDKDGKKLETVETVKIDVKKIAQIPVGISAYGILASLVFQNDPLAPANISVTSFSARGDAMHFSGTVEDATTKKQYETELLVMQDSDDLFILINIYSADNALDPVSRESTDWLRAVRIIKKIEAK